MAELNLSRQTVQTGVVVLTIAGEADAVNGLQIEKYFDEVVRSEQPRHVLLDLGGLLFAGSSFFASLLFWREEMITRGGKLVLYGLRPEVASTMRLLTLDRVLTMVPDQRAALAAVAGAASQATT
jgi:anti-anti-sigma factor